MILQRLEERAAAWLESRRHARMMRRFGGIQRCPWCRRVAQDGDGWSFELWPCNAMCDVLTCGVCGGTSVWHFAMGMHAMGPLNPPSPDATFPNHIAMLAAAPEAPGRG